jgi:hypothetical protein
MSDPRTASRAFFSRFPEEVFSLWLDDRIRSNGWPPSGIEWAGFLSGRSPEEWQGFSWTKRMVTLSPSDLSSTSLNIAVQMFEAHILQQGNLLSAYIPDSKTRFEGLRQFIAQNARLPAPLILLRSAGGYDVIDGNHRVAAMLSLGMTGGACAFFPQAFEAWIAA